MELVYGIVTANAMGFGATNPAPYDNEKRPGKETDADGRTGDVVLLGSLGADNTNTDRVKTDGTLGDVSIAAVDGSAANEVFTNARKLTMTDDVAPSVGRFADGSVHSRYEHGRDRHRVSV